MALEAGGLPDFGLDSPRPHYDAERLVFTVLWPLVRHYTRMDFVDEGVVSDDFLFRRRGTYKGDIYDVTLGAYHDLMKGDEDEGIGIPIISTVHMIIEPHLNDERSDMILSKAAEEDVDVDFDSPEDYTVKTSTDYSFDTDGDIEITTTQTVEDVGGELVWSSQPEDAGDEDYDDDADPSHLSPTEVVLSPPTPDPRIYSQDLVLLRSGLYILKAPKFIKRSFRAVRKNPILPE